MTSKKKKVFILVGMVALLVLTGVLNIVLNSTFLASNNGDDALSSDYFTSYKLERINSREESFLLYDSIINSAETSAEAKAAAEVDRNALARSVEIELVLEGLIKGLGYEDAIVTSTTQNVNVFVKCQELTSVQATQIYQIITTEIDVPATNVRINTSE